jgi:hypothetical protein
MTEIPNLDDIRFLTDKGFVRAALQGNLNSASFRKEFPGISAHLKAAPLFTQLLVEQGLIEVGVSNA